MEMLIVPPSAVPFHGCYTESGAGRCLGVGYDRVHDGILGVVCR